MASDNSLLTIAVVLVILAGAAFYMTYNNQFAFNKVLFAPEEGNVTVVVAESLTINVDPSLIDWGSGFVNTTSGSSGAANLSSENEYIDFVSGSPSPNNIGFNVENTGNVNATIDIATGKNSTILIGGSLPDPIYTFKVTDCSAATCVADDDGTASCASPAGFTKAVYTDVNTTGPGTRVCDQFGFDSINDKFRIDVRVLIPANAPVEPKNDTMVITAGPTA